MKLGQKFYTTFYASENKIGVTIDEVKKSVFQEDGNLIEEFNVTVLLSDGTKAVVNVNHLEAYENDSEIPEFFMLPTQKQLKLKKDEEELLKEADSKYTAKIEFGGSGLKNVVREFTGSKLEIHAYVEKMRSLLQPVGYTSISQSTTTA